MSLFAFVKKSCPSPAACVRGLRRVTIVVAGVSTVLLIPVCIIKRRSIQNMIRNVMYNVMYNLRQTFGISLNSWLLDFFSSPVMPDHRAAIRKIYPEFVAAKHLDPTHTHAAAAAIRTTANNFIAGCCLMLGRTPYSISSSKTDENNDLARERYYHFAKDLQYKHHKSSLAEDHAIIMTDVDYYVDMSEYLKGQPVFISTFAPTDVCGTTHNASYTIGEDNQLVMYVNGGARYVHQLWDYETDHFLVDHWWGSVFYLVERYAFSTDRVVVCFIPIRIIYGPFAWFIPGDRLRRRVFEHNGFGHIRYHLSKDDASVEVRHSIGRLNSYNSVSLSDAMLNAIFTRLRIAKQPAISDVERIIRSNENSGIQDPPFAATLIYDFWKANEYFLEAYSFWCWFWRHTTGNDKPVTSFRTQTDSYQSLSPLVTEDGKEVSRRAMVPLCDDGYHPVRSHNNDHACINGRVHNVRNQLPTRKIPGRYWSYMLDFVNLLVGDYKHKLVPLDFESMMEQVAKRGTRAVLKAETDAHDLYHDSGFVQAFQKAESYGKITDPRNISTLPTKHNFRLGQFVYAFSQVMKQQPWYAFGVHPTKVGERMMEIAEGCQELVPSDISKNDGSVPFMGTALDIACYTAAFAPEYASEVQKLFHAGAKANGVTKTGVTYAVNFTTTSGSSATSDRNTRLNAFISYCALRDSGFSAEDAYKKLGMYGGDDGTNRCVSAEALRRAFANIGMCCTAESVAAMSPVPFLGRLFIDPWTTNESISDVRRAITKFHIVHVPSTIPDDIVLVRKAQGYLATDPDTPLLSDLCHAILRAYQPLCTESQRLVGKPEIESMIQRNVYYYSKFEAPFPRLSSFDLVRHVIAENMDSDAAHIDAVIEKLRAINSVEDFSSVECVFHANRKVDITAAYRGEIVQGAKDPTPDPNDSKHQKTVVENRKEPEHGHEHICKSCNARYKHYHPYKNAEHRQFDYQCPNAHCKLYFGNGNEHQKANPTQSVLAAEVSVVVIDNDEQITVEQPTAAPKFDNEKDADEFYGFAFHPCCCKRCGRFNRHWEDSKCDHYPHCKDKNNAVTETIIKNGDKSRDRFDLAAPKTKVKFSPRAHKENKPRRFRKGERTVVSSGTKNK